jgi:uncharacterized integral membrane protein
MDTLKHSIAKFKQWQYDHPAKFIFLFGFVTGFILGVILC